MFISATKQTTASSIAIYEWESWDGYMLPRLVPEGIRVSANPFHDLNQIMGLLPRGLDVFTFHLNCTNTDRFPRCRRELISALRNNGTVVLNSTVTDISKLHLQATCRYLGLPTVATTQGEGSQDDRVIVKTNLNYAGFGERRMSAEQLVALGISLPTTITDPYDYIVCRRHEVTAEMWADPTLAIERFVSNSRHRKFRIYFAGSNLFVSIWTDEDEIKKYRPEQIREEYLTNLREFQLAQHPRLPASLQTGTLRLLQHLRIDVGAADIVEDNCGQCFIIDVNTTSYARAINDNARDYLRAGLLERINLLARQPAAPTYSDNETSVSKYIESLILREKISKTFQPKTKRFEIEVHNERRQDLQKPPTPGSPALHAATRYTNPGDLCVIMPLFNIGDSLEKLQNFVFASGMLNVSGIPLVVVECVFNDQMWLLPGTSNVLRLRTSGAMWQKERIVNRAIESIPREFTKVAWLDADILFQNPNWASMASKLLKDFTVVQLCERAARLPRGRHSYNGDGQVWDTFGKILQQDPNAVLSGEFGRHGHTGFGWAARRDVLEKVGLYDGAITGGGDHIMAHAFCGDWESPCINHMLGLGSRWYAHAVEWAQRTYPLVRARVGVVEGMALHLWHGELTTRKHGSRYAPLRAANFDPVSDIEIDENGCWRWATDKRDLQEALRQYLEVRTTEAASNKTATISIGSGSLVSPEHVPFTRDYTSRNIEIWKKILGTFAGKPNICGVEIGCFEGKSSVWFLENILQHESAHLVCIDTHFSMRFTQNIARFQQKIRLVQSSSRIALRDLHLISESIHFVYIDGDHSAPSVLEDAVLSFSHLLPNGVLIFDDYLHVSSEPNDASTMPKLAIDAFISTYRHRIRVLHTGYQVCVAKIY
jgi:hypothetical protein